MSTVQEIEEAIGQLTAEELSRVQDVLREAQARCGAVDDLVALECANGFDPLPRREGALVTIEDVRRLCAEEGI